MPPVVNDEDRLMFGVRGVFAQYERMKIAERFRLGKVRKARDGNIVASEAPYGYDLVVRKGKRGELNFSETHYAINEEEARVVRMIFKWIADEGMTLRKIVKRLQERGIRPRWSARGVWNTSTLSTLLRNRTYVGEGHYGSSYAVVPENPLKRDGYKKVRKTSRKIRPASEWILVTVPAIFTTDSDKSLFTRAQEQLKRNFAMSQRNKKNHYLLAGKMRCICARSRAGEGPQRGKYLYYRCTGRVHSYPLPPACTEKGINAVIADERVWSELLRLLTSGDLMLKQIEAWKEKHHEKQQPMVDAIGMQKEIEKLKLEEDRYTKAYGTGVVSIEKLDECLGPVRRRIAELERQIMDAKVTAVQYDDMEFPQATEIEEFARLNVESFQDLNFEEKRAIVRGAIDSVIGTQGGSGGQLYVCGSIAIKNYVNVFTRDRNCGPAQCGEIDAF